MTTDILFIHPSDQKRTYQGLSKEYTAIATPAWTLLLAQYVRKQGFQVAVYDVNVEGWEQQVAEELILKYNPRIVIMMVYGHNPSSSTQTMPAARKIAIDIKFYNKNIPIGLGGIHPSALPERTLREEAIDFVIKGEGADTIIGLVKHLKGVGNIRDIKGLWFWKNGKIDSNPPANVVNNLDNEFDGYAWDLLPDLNNYRAHNMHCFQDFHKSLKDDFSDIRSPYVAMNTSLGCPFSCHYCCINAIFGKPKIRYWSLGKVMSWIDELVLKYKVRNIRLDDELFILSPERIERFCDLIIERRYDLNLWVYGRVDTIKETLLPKIKKAGINWICLGIEAGNERVRSAVNKNIRCDIKEVVKSLQSHDISVLGNYMFGLPEDNIDTMQETLDLAMDLNCEFANFYSVMAYPGSRLYEDAIAKKMSVPDRWECFSQLSEETTPLSTNYISGAEVLRFRDEAFYKYHNNPSYLKMVEKKFGLCVRKHIEKMLNLKIERKLLKDEVLLKGGSECQKS
jgi:anaerobic magnesium-protoporphyrin IX monomethyl ester cyclase